MVVQSWESSVAPISRLGPEAQEQGLHIPHFLQLSLPYFRPKMSASEQGNNGNFGSETSNLYGVIDKHK